MDKTGYKEEQKKTRITLRERRVLSSGVRVNLGIKQFKRENRGNSKIIHAFKQTAWATFLKKQEKKETV